MSDNTNANTNRNANELGAVWLKEGNGKKYYFGKLTIDGKEIQFVMFKNDRKEPGSKQPDWRLYRSQPRADGAAPPPPRTAAPQTAPRQTRAPVRAARPTRAPAPTPAPAQEPAPGPEAEYQEALATAPAASPTL